MNYEDGDICWDDPRLYRSPVEAPNFNSERGYVFDDEFDETPPENAVPDGRTQPNEKLNAIIDVVGKASVSGFGPGEDIAAVIGGILAPKAGYHFEFKFWKMK